MDDMKQEKMEPGAKLSERLSKAFLDFGYEQTNMIGLAKAADVSRRSLYYYFSSKEEAFRYVIDHGNAQAVRAGLDAGRAALSAGTDAIEVLTAVVNIRYGENRRRLMASPHAMEINDQAFRRCRDLMIASAISFQAQLAGLIDELQQQGRLKLDAQTTAADLAQLMADGARGTNQSLPPIEADALTGRYRAMVRALLQGTTVKPPPGKS